MSELDPREDERREAVQKLFDEMGETRFRRELHQLNAGVIGKGRAKYADDLLAKLDAQRRAEDPSVQQGWIALNQGKIAIAISILSLVLAAVALIRSW